MAATATEAIDAFLATFDGTPPYSTLESALRDARASMGTKPAPGPTKWSGVILYLIALELVGKYLRHSTVPPLPGARKKRQHLAIAVHEFGTGAEGPELVPTLFGLRCALVHGYGLQNAESRELTYMFGLDERDGGLIRTAAQPWDGKLANASNENVTVVNIWKLGSYVEDLVGRVRDAHHRGEVGLAGGVSPEDLLTFGTFVIGPTPR